MIAEDNEEQVISRQDSARSAGSPKQARISSDASNANQTQGQDAINNHLDFHLSWGSLSTEKNEDLPQDQSSLKDNSLNQSTDLQRTQDQLKLAAQDELKDGATSKSSPRQSPLGSATRLEPKLKDQAVAEDRPLEEPRTKAPDDKAPDSKALDSKATDSKATDSKAQPEKEEDGDDLDSSLGMFDKVMQQIQRSQFKKSTKKLKNVYQKPKGVQAKVKSGSSARRENEEQSVAPWSPALVRPPPSALLARFRYFRLSARLMHAKLISLTSL